MCCEPCCVFYGVAEYEKLKYAPTYMIYQGDEKHEAAIDALLQLSQVCFLWCCLLLETRHYHTRIHLIGLCDSFDSRFMYYQGEDGPLRCCRRTSFAVFRGHMTCLKYLLDHQLGTVDEYDIAHAGYLHSVTFVRWMREVAEVPWDERFMLWAAMSGNMDVLKYGHDHGAPVDYTAVAYAAGAGHLKVIQFLHEAGYDWDVTCVILAAETGNVEMLQYLLEPHVNCPRSRLRLRQLGPHGMSNICSPCEMGVEAVAYAAQRAHLPAVKYLTYMKCPTDESPMRMCAKHMGIIPGGDSLRQTQNEALHARYMKCYRWMIDKCFYAIPSACVIAFDGCQGRSCKNCPTWWNGRKDLLKAFEDTDPLTGKRRGLLREVDQYSGLRFDENLVRCHNSGVWRNG